VPGGPVTSAEEWIGFRWHPLDALADSGLEPAPLRDVLAAWLRNPVGRHVVSGDAWTEIP
jgi:hypothetical protein